MTTRGLISKINFKIMPKKPLRVLVMGAIREHPTPENRGLLDKLLNDSDDEVRAAAEKIADELKAFGRKPLFELVSQPEMGIIMK